MANAEYLAHHCMQSYHEVPILSSTTATPLAPGHGSAAEAPTEGARRRLDAEDEKTGNARAIGIRACFNLALLLWGVIDE